MPDQPRRTTARRPGGPVLWFLTTASLLAAGILGSVGLSAQANGALLVGSGSSGGHATPASGTTFTVPDAGLGAVALPFSIAGTVGGLFPGASLPLQLTVSNPNDVAITVRSITTTVTAGSPHCAATRVKVTRFTGQLRVGAAKTARATVHVTLAHAAPNSCQGARFVFSYRGFATEA